MALGELTVYQKHYDLMLYAIPLLNKYPKAQRYVLGQHTMDALLEIGELIVQANHEKGKERLRSLWKVDEVLERFRLLIRLAKDLKMLPVAQYGNLSERASEVGRLVGGWMKQTRAALE